MMNLLENFRAHMGRTILFAMLLLCGLTLFFAFAHDTRLRLVILGVVTLAYIAWGILHHYVQKDLTVFKVIEYITIAIFAAVGIGTVLGWGL